MKNLIKQEEDLRKEGKLYSNYKDGKPKTFIQKLKFQYKLYPIMLGIIGFLNVILIKKLRKNFDWHTFLWVALIGWPMGIIWGIKVVQFDPHRGAWINFPWSFSGICIAGITLEDHIFYLLCGTLAILLLMFFKSDKSSKILDSFNFKMGMQFIHLVLFLLFANFSEYAGYSNAIWYSLPGMVMLMYAWDEWDMKCYLKFLGLFGLALTCLWDWAAVSWISMYVSGAAGSSQWCYGSWYPVIVNGIDTLIVTDSMMAINESLANDTVMIWDQSSAFINRNYHSWAWLWNNPIEISPWYGISGSQFIAGMYFSFKKFRRSNTIK